MWCNSLLMYLKEPWFKPIKRHPDPDKNQVDRVDRVDKVDQDRVLIAKTSGS